MKHKRRREKIVQPVVQEPARRLEYRDWMGCLFLLASLLLIFGRSLIPGWTLAVGDVNIAVLRGHYMRLPDIYFRSWGTGSLGSAGTPLQPAPAFLLAHIVPEAKYPDANYILHLLLMGIGGYFLAKDMTRSRFAALCGGLFFLLQPHVLSHILPGHTGHIIMAGYIPMTFFFTRRAIRIGTWPNWGLAGGFFGLTVASGTHDVVFFFALLLGMYATFLLIRQLIGRRGMVVAEHTPILVQPEDERTCAAGRDAIPSHTIPCAEKRSDQRNDSRPTVASATGIYRTLAALAAGILLAGAISFAIGYQAIYYNLFRQVRAASPPPVEEAQSSEISPDQVRQERHERWLWATQWSVPADEIVDVAIPGFFGWGSMNRDNPYRGRIGQTEGYPEHGQGLPCLNDISNYLGAVVLMAALMALILRRRDPEIWLFFAIAVVTWLLGLGKHGPLYQYFFRLPYMDTMRNPIKWVYLTSFSVGMLAIYGWAALAEWVSENGSRDRLVRSIAQWAAPALTLLVLIGATVLWALKRNAGGMFWDNPNLVSKSATAILIGGMFWLAAAALWFWVLWRRRDTARSVTFGWLHHWPLWVMAGVFLVEYAYVATQYLPYQKVRDLIPRSQLADFINQQPKPFRIHFLGGLESYFHLAAGYYQWEQLGAPDPRTYDELARYFDALGDDPMRLFALSNVRYLISPGELRMSPEELRHAGLASVYRMETQRFPLMIYKNNRTLPRYFLVPRWETVATVDQGFARLAERSFNYRSMAVITDTEDAIPTPPDIPATRMNVDIRNYSWQRIELNVETDQDAMLVGSDRYHPTWNAFINGSEVQIYRANGMLRAIPIPAGHHQVTLEVASIGYRPLMIAILGWVAMLVCGVVATSRKINAFRNQSHEHPQHT